MKTSRIVTKINSATKQKIIPAIVIDVLGSAVSVLLSTTGKKMTGLNFIGPTPSKGQSVWVNYQTGVPYVQTSGSVASDGDVIATPIVSTNLTVQVAAIESKVDPAQKVSNYPAESGIIGACHLDQYGLGIWNDDVHTGQIWNDGDVFIGSDIGQDDPEPDTTSFSIFSNDQTYNDEEMGAGDLLIGSNSENFANMKWDVSEGRLLFRGGTTVHVYIDTDGTLVAGDGSVILSSLGSTIGGFSISETTIESLTDDVGIIIDSSIPAIKLGDMNGVYMILDGANQEIRSSNFSTGYSGMRIGTADGNVEINNLTARGLIRTIVFEKETLSSIGGDFLVRPSDVLASDMTALDAETLTVSGSDTFAIGDILCMKNGTDVEWFEVTNDASAPTYSVTRDKAAVYDPDDNPTWQAGQAVVNYGQSGDGGVMITSGASPRVSMFTHAGSPWDTITEEAYLSPDGFSAGGGQCGADQNGFYTQAATDVHDPLPQYTFEIRYDEDPIGMLYGGRYDMDAGYGTYWETILRGIDPSENKEASFVIATWQNEGNPNPQGGGTEVGEWYSYITAFADYILLDGNVAIGQPGSIEVSDDYALSIFGDTYFDGDIYIGGSSVQLQDVLVYIKVMTETTALAIGDGKRKFTVPQELNGKSIISAHAAIYTASSSGDPSIGLYNETQDLDIMTTEITIDAGDLNSYTATTPPEVNETNAVLATGDIVWINVSAAGTDTQGLDIILVVR